MASLYSKYKDRNKVLKNNGYDYRGRLLLRNTYSGFWDSQLMAGFGELVEATLQNIIFSIKSIKKSVNIYVKKDDDDTN